MKVIVRLDPAMYADPTIGDKILTQMRVSPYAILLIRADKNAVVPTKNHPHDSGVDITVIEGLPRVPPTPGNPLADITCPLDTGWYIYVSRHFKGLVMPVSRSGLSIRGVTVANAPGIIDPDYCGPLRIITRSCYNVQVSAGQRVAQLVSTNPAAIISYIDELQTAEQLKEWVKKLSKSRGDAGYGSSGT